MATLVSPGAARTADGRAFPGPLDRPWGGARLETPHRVGDHLVLGQHVIDLRDQPPDHFEDVSATDWRALSWSAIGKPYSVERWSAAKREHESAHGRLRVHEGWEYFNRSFHQFFLSDLPADQARARAALGSALAHVNLHDAQEAIADLFRLAVWNKIHRVEDAVWDPRGKRALFAGLEVKKPRILFLGAADGYEAMQLYAQYPGGEVVLVDYDAFCATDRFGKFPADYPFLGVDPATGHQRVWYREEMPIHFEVSDIRQFAGGLFDVVVSIGLIEHFDDPHKAECFDWHRQFVKPGGWVVMTTPRNQWRGRAFYSVMADYMNFGYRELMDVWQMGRYAHDAGFDIRRAGVIKAHNGLLCKVR